MRPVLRGPSGAADPGGLRRGRSDLRLQALGDAIGLGSTAVTVWNIAKWPVILVLLMLLVVLVLVLVVWRRMMLRLVLLAHPPTRRMQLPALRPTRWSSSMALPLSLSLPLSQRPSTPRIILTDAPASLSPGHSSRFP